MVYQKDCQGTAAASEIRRWPALFTDTQRTHGLNCYTLLSVRLSIIMLVSIGRTNVFADMEDTYDKMLSSFPAARMLHVCPLSNESDHAYHGS